MIRVNQGTKKHNALVQSFDNSIRRYGKRDIYDCYAKPSVYKWGAYAACARCKMSDGGHKGTITGYNCMQFTYAYLRTSAETGVLELVTITKAHIYVTEYDGVMW